MLRKKGIFPTHLAEISEDVHPVRDMKSGQPVIDVELAMDYSHCSSHVTFLSTARSYIEGTKASLKSDVRDKIEIFAQPWRQSWVYMLAR